MRTWNHYRSIGLLVVLTALALGFAAPLLGAQTPHANPDNTAGRVPLRFTLWSDPFNRTDGSYRFPAMQQSLDIAMATQVAVHEGLGYLLEDRIGTPLTSASLGIFDLLLYPYLIGSGGWLHEEWHRAVMTNRNIESYNGYYDFQFFAATIAVSRVSDEDLIGLKRDHPTDMVRLAVAGLEAQLELTKRVRAEYFFSRRDPKFVRTAWLADTILPAAYIAISRSDSGDELIDEANANENTIAARDFTGLDFTAWVYDLHRPDEAYQNRGVHPSGTGIDRYIRYSDLSATEQNYLRLQSVLTWLNLLSPALWGFDRFEGTNPVNGAPLYWNAAVMHYLTSFGYTIDAHAMVQQGDFSIALTYHNYVNQANYFPGIDLQLVRYPMTLGTIQSYASPRVALWLQPKDQAFRTSLAQLGALAALELAFPVSDSLQLFTAFEAKSEGWVAGNVSLDRAYRATGGLVYRF